MRIRHLSILIAAALLASLPALAQDHVTDAPQIIEGPQTAPPPKPALMDNRAVLRMHDAGLTDDLIVQTIATQPGKYDTGPDDLIGLKSAGISNPIIAAMTAKARRQITGDPAPRPIELSPVNEIGVYYKDAHGNWIAMDSEIVHVNSGGFIKNTISDGIIKTDRNGVVDGPESKLLLPRPIEFLIYTPDGVTASEYEMVAFRLHAKTREFRIMTGGVIHSTGGAKRDDVPFTPVKIAPRTWTFTLGQDTPGAEYGILPPGTGNVTNGGKIYTFAISE